MYLCSRNENGRTPSALLEYGLWLNENYITYSKCAALAIDGHWWGVLSF
jgi:hypothetical protein